MVARSTRRSAPAASRVRAPGCAACRGSCGGRARPGAAIPNEYQRSAGSRLSVTSRARRPVISVSVRRPSSPWPPPAERSAILVGQQRVHPVDGDELLGDRVRRRRGRRGGEPGMPPSSPSARGRRSHRGQRGPSRPDQFACIAAWTVGWARMAGVHSTVWILAITAAFTSRAVWNRRSSSQPGWRAARWSQMALCSRANRSCSSARPEPPVAVDARQVDAGVALEGQPAVLAEPQLAVAGQGPQLALALGRAAVELGAVPPVGLGVDEHRRAARSGPPLRGRGARDLHRGRPARASRRPAAGAPRCARRVRPSRGSIQSWTMNCSQAAASRFRIVAS